MRGAQGTGGAPVNHSDGAVAGTSRTALAAEPDEGPRPGRGPAGLLAGIARVGSLLWNAERPEHGFAFDRQRLTAWFALFAVYAAALTAFSGGGADGAWGLWATGGYALAAILAYRSRGFALPLLAGLGFALAAPTIWLAVRAPATADVSVVSRSAVLLLHTGSPYLSAGQLATWQSYNPYLPAMALFGLPHALGLRGVLGDPRPWLIAVTAVLLAASFWMGAPHRGSGCRDCRVASVWFAAFGVACPLLALPLAVGITDPPVIALVCLAFACVARSPRLPVAAGLAVGVACAMKATAWPALAVIAALLVARDGSRVAARSAVTAVVTIAGLIVVTAPGLLATPSALLQNIVLYPLGMTLHKTPAASPLPGHVLADTGPAGHLAAVGLLIAAGLAVGLSLVLRPPADVPAAVRRLAIGLALMFLLAPATRFGYFAYPVALLGWSALTRPGRPAPDADATQAGEPATTAVGALAASQPQPATEAGTAVQPTAPTPPGQPAAPAPPAAPAARTPPGQPTAPTQPTAPADSGEVLRGIRHYLLAERSGPCRSRRRKPGQDPMAP